MPGRYTFLDAGVFIGALLQVDPRHGEARPLVDAARRESGSPAQAQVSSAKSMPLSLG